MGRQVLLNEMFTENVSGDMKNIIDEKINPRDSSVCVSCSLYVSKYIFNINICKVQSMSYV